MKHLLTVTTLALILNTSYSQVKIGGEPAAPPPSAVLELDGGSSKGLLLPRMRKMDIDAIQDPSEGLTIYATDEQAVYLRKSLVWEKQSPFNLPYIGIFNTPNSVLNLTNNTGGGIAITGFTDNGSSVAGLTNKGNGILGIASTIDGIGGYFYNSLPNGISLISKNYTGIGTFSGSPTGRPEVLLHINGQSTTGNTVIIDDDIDPVIQFRKAGINKSYIKQEGNNLVFRPNDQNSSGKVVLQAYNAGGWLFVDADGNTSLGINPIGFTGTPYNSRMNIRSSARPTLTLDGPSGTFDGPSLLFVDKAGNNINEMASIEASNSELKQKSTGKMYYESKANVSALAYQWTNNLLGITTLMSLTPNGLLQGALNVGGSLGIGNMNQAAALHINAGNSGFPNAVVIEDTDPIIRIRNGNTDKGFIQVVGDDIKVGTVITNDVGNFMVRTNGADRVVVRPDGKMVLGSPTGSAPVSNHLLAVKGRIAASEFTVTALASWPDYVFDDSYQLRSLEETEAFIKVNKHLPNMPAASLVEKEGYGLGDMQKRMMEKIEELTLHLIEANKEIQLLKKQVALIQ